MDALDERINALESTLSTSASYINASLDISDELASCGLIAGGVLPSTGTCAGNAPDDLPTGRRQAQDQSSEPRDGYGRLASGEVCTDRDSFVLIDFENAGIVRSNLGGLGGRCTEENFADGVVCTDGATTPSTPHDIYLSNVGRTRNGETVDIRITVRT